MNGKNLSSTLARSTHTENAAGSRPKPSRTKRTALALCLRDEQGLGASAARYGVALHERCGAAAAASTAKVQKDRLDFRRRNEKRFLTAMYTYVYPFC